MVRELADLKQQLGLRPDGEIKWDKVSRSYGERYRIIMKWFFEHLDANHIRFRAHIIDTGQAAYRQYGDGKKENSFYKVYYHVLMQSVRRLALDGDGSNVVILLDRKRAKYRLHLPVIKRGLNMRLFEQLKIPGLVASIEERNSSGPGAEPLIQIVDVLIGAIGHVRNGHRERVGASTVKAEMVCFLEDLAGTSFKFDTTAGAPFNLWTFSPSIAIERKKRHQEKRKTAPPPNPFRGPVF